MIDSPASRRFPDLQRVGPGKARHALWSAAYLPVFRSPTYWLIALVTQVVAQFAVVVPLSRLARQRGLYGPVVQFGLPGIVAAFAVFVIIWLVRRRITRNLRHELNRGGLPTCLKCGYNLTGNVSGVCPECGRKLERT